MKIVSSMVQATRLMEHVNKNYQSDPHGYDSSDEEKQATGEFVDSFKDARVVFTSNILLISKLFHKKFEDIHNEISIISADDNLIPPESANRVWLAMDNGYRELLSIAKAEVLEK
jgi:esterase/lipase